MNNHSHMRLILAALKLAVTEIFRDYLMRKYFVVYTNDNPFCYYPRANLGATELHSIMREFIVPEGPIRMQMH